MSLGEMCLTFAFLSIAFAGSLVVAEFFKCLLETLMEGGD